MKKEILLYSSKKLKSYIGKQLEVEKIKESSFDSHELYHWYGDVFFYQRKRFLIFSNELTRFIFAVGPYTINKKQPLFELFKEGLEAALTFHGIDSNAYLQHLVGLAMNPVAHPGSTAHLNTAKGDYLYWLAYDGNTAKPEEVPRDFNNRVNNLPVTKKSQKG